MKFKAPIEVQAGISDGDPTNPLGQSGYLLSSDGSNVNWVSPGELSAETAEAIVQPIKADEALAKGDPLYIVGYQTGQDVNIVAKANSSDPTKMPVVGLADDDYANQAFGTMTAFGSFNGDFDTTGPGTETWAIGDIIFVKPGGGLTNIKPGGTDLIQNVAIVSRVNSQTGELEVIALGRTNDVPNLPTGRLFVGTATNTSLISDVVYVDDANERMGIRTTGTPSTNLEVSSSSNLNGIDISVTTNPTQSGALFFTTNTPSEGFMFRNANGTFQINSGGIPNSASGNNRISIIGSSGNVGIGTNNPGTYKLAVAGSTAIGENLEVSDGLGGDKTLSIDATIGAFQIGDIDGIASEAHIEGDGSNIKIFTSGSETLVCDINQNVGIGTGTTSPADRLEVAAANSQLRLRDTDDNNFAQFSYSSGKLVVRNNSTTTTVNQFTLDSIGRMGIGTTSPNRLLTVETTGSGCYLALNSSSNNTTIGSDVNGAFVVYDDSSGAYRMVIEETTGNVGIGETNPNYKLEVGGTLGVNRTDGIIFAGSAAPGLGNKITSDTLNNFIFSTSLPSVPYTTSPRMTILNGGNVGIGITNPTAILHVQGSTNGPIPPESRAVVVGNNTASQAYYNNGIGVFGKTIQSDGMAIHGDAATGGGYGGYFTGRGYFSGNVGIGVPGPQEKLEVNGTVKATEYKGYLPAFQHGGFYHSSSTSSSTIYWIPTNYFSEVTSSQYYNNWVAPYSGRVKKIVMRWTNGTTPTATSVTFRKSINGGGDLNTYPATIANAASTTMTATRVFGSTDIAFNEGDRVMIGFTTNGGTRLLYGFAYTIVLEYNKD